MQRVMDKTDKEIVDKLFSPNHDNEVTDWSLSWYRENSNSTAGNDWFVLISYKGRNKVVFSVDEALSLWRDLHASRR